MASSIASDALSQIMKLACYAMVEGATGKKINIARDDLGCHAHDRPSIEIFGDRTVARITNAQESGLKW